MPHIIESVELKHGENGDYWRLKAGGVWMSSFSGPLGQQLAVGKDADQLGQIVSRGKFTNLEPFAVTENYDRDGNTVAPGPKHPLAPQTPAPKPFASGGPDYRDLSIQRQTCLKAAAHYAGTAIPFESVDKTGQQVVALASYFLAWIHAGQE